MFLVGKYGAHLRKAVVGLRLLTVFSLCALTVLQGLTLCLCCSPDPDGYEGSCHECGAVPEPDGAYFEHVCDHLSIDELPPGTVASHPLDELLSVLVWIADFRLPVFEARPSAAPAFPSGCPPDICPPQLIFIARSAQILC
jgi:hypothetical protein